MNFLGIGPLELVVLFVIVLLVMGPQDIGKFASSLGRTIRKIQLSDMLKNLQSVRKMIRNAPTELSRRAGLEDLEKQIGLGELNDLKNGIQKDLSVRKQDVLLDSWTNPPQKSERPKEQIPSSQKPNDETSE